MTNRIDHAKNAEIILADGLTAVHKCHDAAHAGYRDKADDYGKKAMGCWAQAQAEATLALVEQQRIANLIALAAGGHGGSMGFEHEATEALGNHRMAEFGDTIRLHPDVAAALGIEVQP